jgi:hypothetical protein
MWGDNGGECSRFALLPALFYASEIAKGHTNKAEIRERFQAKYGISFDRFMLLDLPGTPGGGDRAVRDPEKYLLGILFDDSRAALDDTVRDRCILQKNVLRRMNWNLTNVWLLDWFDSPDTQIHKMKQRIGRLLAV